MMRWRQKDKNKVINYFGLLKDHLHSAHEKSKREAMDTYELLDHLKSLVGETSTGEKNLVSSFLGNCCLGSLIFPVSLLTQHYHFPFCGHIPFDVIHMLPSQ